jgi:hypothetical protein
VVEAAVSRAAASAAVAAAASNVYERFSSLRIQTLPHMNLVLAEVVVVIRRCDFPILRTKVPLLEK